MTRWENEVAELESVFEDNPHGWRAYVDRDGYWLCVRLPDGTANSFAYETFEEARQGALLMLHQTRRDDALHA